MHVIEQVKIYGHAKDGLRPRLTEISLTALMEIPVPSISLRAYSPFDL